MKLVGLMAVLLMASTSFAEGTKAPAAAAKKPTAAAAAAKAGPRTPAQFDNEEDWTCSEGGTLEEADRFIEDNCAGKGEIRYVQRSLLRQGCCLKSDMGGGKGPGR